MSDRSKEKIELPEMGVTGAQFSPKLVYLGLAMIVLLLANTFLASQKNKLQAEIDRQNLVILELRQTIAEIQGSTLSAEDEVSSSE